MDNYICINGKKAELTKEQMKALGIELSKAKNPFERQSYENKYYYIQPTGLVVDAPEFHNYFSDNCYGVANYCTDKAIMEQRALHETLNRLLWRYSMEHDGDKVNWNDRNTKKYFIYYNHVSKNYGIDGKYDFDFIADVYFYEYETAEKAIREIIEPFMKAHPEFKW